MTVIRPLKEMTIQFSSKLGCQRLKPQVQTSGIALTIQEIELRILWKMTDTLINLLAIKTLKFRTVRTKQILSNSICTCQMWVEAPQICLMIFTIKSPDPQLRKFIQRGVIGDILKVTLPTTKGIKWKRIWDSKKKCSTQ